MSRPKGSKNKNSSVPYTVSLTTEERVWILADTILDVIEEEIKNGTLPEIEKPEAQSDTGSSSTSPSSTTSA